MNVSATADYQYEQFFGLPLSTHRAREEADDYFLYEAMIAGISILFFRSTVHWKEEPATLRWFFALVLGFLSFFRKSSYQLIYAVEGFSFFVPLILGSEISFIWPLPEKATRLALIALVGVVSMLVSHWAASGDMIWFFSLITPTYVVDIWYLLLPIDEVKAAYHIMGKFQKAYVLSKQVSHLLFVTFHIQFGIGYLGIDFLRLEQVCFDLLNCVLSNDHCGNFSNYLSIDTYYCCTPAKAERACAHGHIRGP